MDEDKRSLVEKIKDEAVPTLVAGAVGVVASNMLLGVDLTQDIPIIGTSLPAWAVIGGTVGGAVLVSELAHDWVFEKIPVIKKYADMESRVLAPVLAGGGAYLVLRFGVSENTSIMNSVLLGAGSSVAGQYINSTISNRL